jgi:hypothetical protein
VSLLELLKDIFVIKRFNKGHLRHFCVPSGGDLNFFNFPACKIKFFDDAPINRKDECVVAESGGVLPQDVARQIELEPQNVL